MSESSLRISGDVIVLPYDSGRWALYNVFTRTSLVVSTLCLEAISSLAASSATTSYSRSYTIWESAHFSNYAGLLADPTRIKRAIPINESREVGFLELIELLKTDCFLVDDIEAYRSRFRAKTSVLDAQNFGNFHEQLGQHLMLIARENPEVWWVNQKFTPDSKDVQNNLYGAIQKENLVRYFNQRFNAGNIVYDIGCGIGFYSNLMATTGATVHGIDPNPRYIEVAARNAHKNAKFSVADLGKSGAMHNIPAASADYVFMSDALLFYFVSPDRTKQTDITILLDDIKRILKPNGVFISVEPHYMFWLAPWLGESDRPFTIFTEYLNRNFLVTPPYSSFIQALADNGFAVQWMEEFTPAKTPNDRGNSFAQEFPLWQLFEFIPHRRH